jgi:imidazolonepropionase-like amidohydrolase
LALAIAFAIASMVAPRLGLAQGGDDTSASFAITHVTVIDGTGRPPQPDRTIVVEGSRITAVGAATSTIVPHGIRVVDGRGKYVIPGLWDMHVHTDFPAGRELLALYIANGVTGVRDMAGRWETLTVWRREIARGALVGPRIVASGPYLEGGDVPIPHLTVRRAEEAAPAVDSLIRLGVDFVKVHGQMTPESYYAVARAARARGIPLAGHVPYSVGAGNASDSGVKSLEHLLTIPNQCTPAESTALVLRFPLQRVFGACAREPLAPLFARFVRNGTWIVPTLVAQYEIAALPKHAVPGDAYARYLPDTVKRYVAQIFELPKDVPANADVVGLRLFGKRVALVGEMHRAGVQVMTGTDAPLRNSPPGFGLHEELALFVRGGLSPMDAIRAATSAPARYLGLQDSLGTVEQGKVADLVVLDADPLRDIANTRRIIAVSAGGRLFDRAQRDRLLDEALARARR